MSNPNQPGRTEFTPCGPAQTFEALTARVGLSLPDCANEPVRAGEPSCTERQEARFALATMATAIGLWAFIVYELASRLQPPTLF